MELNGCKLTEEQIIQAIKLFQEERNMLTSQQANMEIWKHRKTILRGFKYDMTDESQYSLHSAMIKEIGTAGAGNQRLVWWSMGSFRQRVYELSISTAANRDLIDEDFQYEVGGL